MRAAPVFGRVRIRVPGVVVQNKYSSPGAIWFYIRAEFAVWRYLLAHRPGLRGLK
jgi:hypothetical protein